MGDNGNNHNGKGDYSDEQGDRVCRDFMRNVCSRANCKFIHPENIKIRTEPIFCHDFQQGECISKRKQCKFIHCSREDEEHYKQTGELPENASGTEFYEPKPIRGAVGRKPPNSSRGGSANSGGQGGGSGRGRNGYGNNRNGNGSGRNETNGYYDNNEIPVCKDYLKGLCDRPVNRCKFRHVSVDSPKSYGTGGGGIGGNRRRVSNSYFDGGPESKRSNHYSTEPNNYFDFSSNIGASPPPPPPPPQNFGFSQNQTGYQNDGQVQGVNQNNSNNNGYNTISQLNESMSQSQLSSFSTSVSSVSANNNNNNTAATAAMKALEDENFMLKRRIEELKKNVNDLVATNEYLLSQNAHFRLNNMTKEVQVGQAPTGSVLVSMAQPIQIQNPSLSCSVAASASGLSTITSIPTVSMTPVSSLSLTAPVVSMSQHPSINSQPQTVYPITGVLAPPN